MIQFNIHRFGRLLKWTMQQDKAYYKKSFLQIVVVLLLAFIFLFFVATYGKGDVKTNFEHSYATTSGMVMLVMIGAGVLGPASMFHSLKGKHDRQALLLIPASNFEKYLVRYMSWIFMIPLWIVAVLLADVLQYFIHWIMGYEYYQFVVVKMIETIGMLYDRAVTAPKHMIVSAIVCCVWLHSFYAVGATFFRSRRFSFIYSSFAWIGISMLVVWIFPNWSLHEPTTEEAFLVGNIVYVVWSIVNFWLSYVIFCRTQVIGKFVNY